jgi:hypothetical protein
LEVDFLPNIELAFLNIPLRLAEESFCANNKIEANKKMNEVLIFFIELNLNF